MSEPTAFELLVDAVADAVAERVLAVLDTEDPTEGVHEWRLLGVGEVAALLGRCERWVRDAVKKRGLPYVRLDGGAYAFDLDDVREWAESRRVPARAEDPLATRLQVPGDRAPLRAPGGRSRSANQKVSE